MDASNPMFVFFWGGEGDQVNCRALLTVVAPGGGHANKVVKFTGSNPFTTSQLLHLALILLLKIMCVVIPLITRVKNGKIKECRGLN